MEDIFDMRLWEKWQKSSCCLGVSAFEAPRWAVMLCRGWKIATAMEGGGVGGESRRKETH